MDLTQLLRARIRAALAAVLDEELEVALGCAAGERSPARAGYRHGALTRPVVTQCGRTTLSIPRARLLGADGTLREWRSGLLRRYQRRIPEEFKAALQKAG